MWKINFKTKNKGRININSRKVIASGQQMDVEGIRR
jgi:hypothetical protein